MLPLSIDFVIYFSSEWKPQTIENVILFEQIK